MRIAMRLLALAFSFLAVAVIALGLRSPQQSGTSWVARIVFALGLAGVAVETVIASKRGSRRSPAQAGRALAGLARATSSREAFMTYAETTPQTDAVAAWLSDWHAALGDVQAPVPEELLALEPLVRALPPRSGPGVRDVVTSPEFEALAAASQRALPGEHEAAP